MEGWMDTVPKSHWEMVETALTNKMKEKKHQFLDEIMKN